jgi:hypothetical protein
MTSKPHDPARAVDQLISLAQSTFTDDMTAREQEGFERLASTMASRGPSRRLRALTLGLGLTAAAILVPFVLVSAYSRPNLSFRIASSASSSAGGVSRTAGRIDFSDGSSVVLDTDARASVSEVGSHGARVRLDSGRLRTHFVPLRDAHWSVDAGPYLVTVTGTTFDVAWTPTEQVMEVWMHKGTVVVQGPLADPGISVAAGQHLRANGLTGQILLDRIAAENPEGGTSAATEPPSPRPVESPRLTPASARDPASHPLVGKTLAAKKVGTIDPETSWSKLLARGESSRILDEAEAHGMDRALATASGADLAALADAARYARKDSLAARALFAERTRFPQSLAAQDAAFFLGGIYEGRTDRSSLSSALEWYDRYLHEAGSGSYMAQALGRKLLVLEKLHDTENARQTASEYLRRFPTGPYAATAKRIATAAGGSLP